jgi:ubiquinone/menaquinone biosynthesis C-methylase UbiE
MILKLKRLKHHLAGEYMYWRTAANVFRLHELAFLRRHLIVRDTDIALDIACGIGLYTNRIFKRAKQAVGMDLVHGNIQIAQYFRTANTAFYRGNAERLCHHNSSFDVVVSICALEHFHETDQAIAEMHRVLKPGGRLLLTVDSLGNITSPEFLRFHREFCQVVRYFSPEDIRARLERAGFDVERVAPMLTSTLSAHLCMMAFRIMSHPLLFNIYSCLAYPLTCIADWALPTQQGITIGVCARKPMG